MAKKLLLHSNLTKLTDVKLTVATSPNNFLLTIFEKQILQKMFLLAAFLLPMVLGEQFLFFDTKNQDQGLTQCIGEGILSCKRVSNTIIQPNPSYLCQTQKVDL